MNINVVIMAGGSGTRLWPLSRASYPKQFLSLIGDETLLQATVSRLEGLNINSITTICNEQHRFMVAEQLRNKRLDKIILEPDSKNTAPAAAMASFIANKDDIILILAADHVIGDVNSFTKTIEAALPLAQADKLVAFGVIPSEPNSGYGYIKSGSSIESGFVVDSFVEKPTVDIAKEYISSGDYFWNSGMFLFKAKTYLSELNKYSPEIYKACKASIDEKVEDSDFIRPDESKFEHCPSDSIDYAVMEKTNNAVIVPMDTDWSDIGSWSSLHDISTKDEHGNVVKGDSMVIDSRDSFIESDDRFTAVIGVEDMMIISTKDALLVAHKDSSQETKVIVDNLKDKSRTEWEHHREVHRPWGKYDSIDVGANHQTKRITVKPGGKLSVQLHRKRSEHWVVVSGKAKVTNGEDTFELVENESTYIPVGAVHALENIGDKDLEIIEVQYGSYLGEDDIERISDVYGRNSKD